MRNYRSRNNYMCAVRAILIIFSLLSNFALHAQTSSSEGVKYAWEGRLINHQTASLPGKGETSIFIVHYFGPVSEKGIDDIFGIYGTSNIQLGVEHGLGENFSTYFFTEKINKSQELGFRYRLSQQTRDGESPVSVVANFSVGYDARDKKYFGVNYYFIDRFFYTTQIAVSKQIDYRWEMMVNGTFAHFNIVPEGAFSTFISLNPSLAYKINRRVAFFGAFDFPLGVASASDGTPQKADPLMTLGAIFGTMTHNFQLFITNGDQINPAKEYLNNHSGFSAEALRIGFNIHVKFGGGGSKSKKGRK